MKFYQIDSFKQHLKSVSREHLSHFFVLIISDGQERKKMAQHIAENIEERFGAIDLLQTVDYENAKLHMVSSSMLAEVSVLLFEPDKLLDQEKWEALASLSPNHFLIVLLKESQEGIEKLYLKMKKQVEWLDLTSEKPWELQQRLKRFAQDYVGQYQRSFAAKALELFFEKVLLERGLLEQELDKLLALTEGRSQIERQDVEMIVSDSKRSAVWQTVQQILWEGKIEAVDKALEVGDGLSLLYPLRQQIEQGWAVAFGVAQHWQDDDFIKELPHLKPKALSEHRARAQELGLSFFKAAWEALYDCEVGLKSGGDEKTLFYLFISRLHALKDALSVS